MPRSLLALLILATPVCADDKKEPNPEYAAWAKHKAGTSVVLAIAMTGPEMVDATATLKLVEVTDEKVTFEQESVQKVNGKEEKKTEKWEMPKTGESRQMLYYPRDSKTGKPKGKIVDEGTEKLKIGGTEFECKWYKLKDEFPSGMVAEGQVWLCDAFPGGVVKGTAKVTDGKEVRMTQSVTATDVTIKK